MNVMEEWFVGPLIYKIMTKFSNYPQYPFGLNKDLARLLENYLKIKTVMISVANKGHIMNHDPALFIFFWKLRDAIDDAEDLLDEFEYMNHEEKVAKNMEEMKLGCSSNILYDVVKRLYVGYEHGLKINANLKRLEKVVKELDEVVGTLLFLIKITKWKKQDELDRISETGSVTDDLIGQDEIKESIIKWLRKPSNEEDQTHVSTTNLYSNISLLSIVGHGGMGKTNLLQHVYQEDEITKEFDLKMWVCVSHNFDMEKVLRDMLENLANKRYNLTLSGLQENLKSKVRSKKFLLVLDDIWGDDKVQDKKRWQKVLYPLTCGGFGSKILITTRKDSVAYIMSKVIKKKQETLILNGLQEDDCLQLLTMHAFDDARNPDDYIRLRSIAEKLVKPFCGYPFAAMVIGTHLNKSLDFKYWTNVLNHKLYRNDIFSLLHLSYTSLSIHLQNCFKFCSIFPQDHLFDKDDLVRMWIAMGFIPQCDNQGGTLEIIGDRFFDVLVSNLFFDKVDNEGYKMHGLLYEFAQYVSRQECLRVVGEELPLKIPKTIRHLSVETSNLEVLKNIRSAEYLRTLCIKYDKNDQDLLDALSEIFKARRSIHLLHINVESLESVPKGIEYLRNLRYFKMDFSAVTSLPGPLSKLYHLQFISSHKITQHRPSNVLFPRYTINLPNLHYSELPLPANES